MLTTSPSRPARASSVYLFRRGHLLTVRCGLVTLCFRARLRVHVDLDLDFGHSGETSSTTPIATAPPWQTEYVHSRSLVLDLSGMLLSSVRVRANEHALHLFSLSTSESSESPVCGARFLVALDDRRHTAAAAPAATRWRRSA